MEEMESGSLVKFKSGAKAHVASKEQAAEKATSGFGAWDIYGKFFYFGHGFWLMKEIGWVLLLPPIAFIAGGIAVILVGISFFRRLDGGVSGKLYHEAPAEVIVCSIHLVWLVGNCFELVTYFMFDEPEEVFGYAEDLVNFCGDGVDCEGPADSYLMASRIVYGVPVLFWIVGLIYLLYKWIEPPRFVAQGHAFQTCLLEGGWMAFWVMKDFAWSFEEEGFAFAVTAWCIHFVILVVSLLVSSSRTYIWDGLNAEEIERIGDTFTRVDLVSVSYIFWSLSSFLWLLMEEVFDEDLTWRIITVLVQGVAITLFFVGFNQASAKGRTVGLLFSRGVVIDVAANPNENTPAAERVGSS